MSHQAGRHTRGAARPAPSATPLDAFTAELAAELRARGQSRTETREVVTDVRRHLLGTHGDAEAVYGRPREYAEFLVPEPPTAGGPGIGTDVVWALTSGLGGFLVASGGVDTALGTHGAFGVPGWVQLFVGLLLLGVGAFIVSRGLLADPTDHRTGRARLAHFAMVAVAVAGLTALILVGAEVIGG